MNKATKRFKYLSIKGCDFFLVSGLRLENLLYTFLTFKFVYANINVIWHIQRQVVLQD